MWNKPKRERETPRRYPSDWSITTPKTAAAETRDAILGKLRHAVAFQIGLWDIASEIASIVADSGLEQGPEDLEDFLGGGNDLCKVGGKLPEYPVQ